MINIMKQINLQLSKEKYQQFRKVKKILEEQIQDELSNPQALAIIFQEYYDYYLKEEEKE